MQPDTKRRIKISAVVGVITLAFVLLAWLFYFPLFVQYPNLAHEYTTARVIADVQKFVENHNGQWPESWSDIGSGEDIGEHTVVRFDLTTQDFLENPPLIHKAIQPVTGEYFTYPHAQRQLEFLLETIKEKSEQAEPAGSEQNTDSGIPAELPNSVR